MESTKQSNKISDIVRLKQKLKKWRNQAHNAQTNNNNTTANNISSSSSSNNTNTNNTNTNTNSSNSNSSSSSSNSNSNSNNSNSNSNNNNSSSSSSSRSRHGRKGSLSRSNSFKGISFLKRTLSLSDNWANIEMPIKGFPPMDDSKSNNSTNTKSTSSKGITFLKRTLSFTDLTANNDVSSNTVRKGFLAVHVGVEMKRFVIPTNYLSHEAFSVLLKEAEEEFGFQQEGVLRIPCEVQVFENILRSVDEKSSSHTKQGLKFSRNDGIVCGPSDSLSYSHHPPSPMCR